jgi:HlyD family secretion protein
MTKQSMLKRIIHWSKNHKKLSILFVVVIVIIIYYISKSLFGSSSIPTYTLAMARTGSIVQTVTGSGQISASNQTDIQSRASGTIKSINVKVGQVVKAGELIATIDSQDALLTLQNAKISYAKLVQPAKEADIAIAKNNLAKAYDSGFNSVANVFLDLPTILTGLKDLLYGQTGYLSDQNASYLSSVGRNYRDTAGRSYDIAYSKYQNTLQEYKSLTRSSDTSKLDTLIANTYDTIKAVAEATTNAQNAINYIKTNQSEYQSSGASGALSNTTTWAGQANSDVSSIVSAQNSILSSKNSLDTLVTGTDDLDLQSALINLEQAQRTYENNFVRAPYDGIIGRIPVNVYSQASSGTTIATIVGQSKVASISLNEIDAAKVKVGQTVNITFDAIDELNATGTVSVVDEIGTVSSGVVSYGIKIAVNADDARIKPGMSVNTTIVTLQKDNVLVIPTVAIKKSGGESYVQVLSDSVVKANLPATSTLARTGASGTSTMTRNRMSTSTVRAPSIMNNPNLQQVNRTITISTEESPIRITVTTGESDDTNTEILKGITRGSYVVTKTSNAGVTQTSAPSILSGIGGTRSVGGTGAVRPNIPR